MARSETFQERANSSPSLQAFLEKKGDEHAFSCLYLIAGVVCLYAAFSHGGGFCTEMSAADVARTAPPSLAAPPKRALLALSGRATSKVTMAEMKRGNMLDEEAPAEDAAAADGSEATAGDGAADSEVAAEEDTHEERSPGNETSAAAAAAEGKVEADKPAHTGEAFLGPRGWVVAWLTVEGFTALGLPLVSIVMLLLRLHENTCISCLLYLVAVFQALWLIVGCIWAFGGFVPEACRKGEMGDSFAFDTMWWVCAIWLGSMLTISTVICCILACLMGFAGDARGDGGKYEQVKTGQHV